MTAKHPMIPFPVIVRATDAILKQSTRLYAITSGFIASRSMRPQMKDEYGNTHMVVDETLRRRMETRLIAKILSFEIRDQTRNNARLWKRGQTHASQTELASLLKCIITSAFLTG